MGRLVKKQMVKEFVNGDLTEPKRIMEDGKKG